VAADFDAIVIGSGFGGAVSACRLAEGGYKVLVLERGRRWQPKDYPREPGDAWVWDQHHPERRNGWIDLRFFPHMAVAQGAGVGGGSLIYANVSLNAKPAMFEQGWPREITYKELLPHYEEVGRMLDVRPVPPGQWTERAKLVKDAAERLGYGDRFRMVDLAVSFDEKFSYDREDPHDPRHSKTFKNAHGQEQGTCTHLGNCVIGCDVKAKNTLDLNYLARAEQRGAEIRPLHLVRRIAPEDGGYRVHFQRLEGGRSQPGSSTGRLVILAAGSLGSTELLLQCRDRYKTLPNVSRFLGKGWSSNGDFLVPAIYPHRRVSPTRGPTISAAIDFLGERALGGHEFFIEDGGFPDVAGDYLEKLMHRWAWSVRGRSMRTTLRRVLQSRDPLAPIMPWFAQARDAADGTVTLRKRWILFGPKRLYLRWDPERSAPTIDAVAEMHRKLADATGGHPFVPITWTLARYLVTPHPLGGCNMGSSKETGVVDHKGEVFGYKNLYVADGAIFPEAVGLNPSKTIAALAERNAKLIKDEGR